ncbi:glycosyltransferase [Nostoc sp. 106C]|uniref:glycosyltransferase n=1 Tax=Nostoc sp. 106C TaxID=1932667 RepID=UPI000A3CDDD4|nr:glycosyltransferase [Nostoc sp. 106C]OUL19844.1 glycosyl transferase family A [Nostoc sp. RF31YmG]OUL21863.1 glycosyl transferase family A [Nostoc sp. 106C]
MTTISVVIPVFNGEKTIKETISSVLNQTFSQFELILINASSTDATLEVISKIQDERIKIFSYPKANVAVNRNRGFSHSIGEFVSFLDADDLWTPDKLEAQYKALLENPNAAVAYSWTDCIDETGKFLRPCRTVAVTGNVYPHLLLDDFIGNGSNVMIRRQEFIEIGGFDELLTNAQDSDLWLRLAAHYQFVVVPKSQILYRISANSMSADVYKMEKACLQVIKRTFKQTPSSLQYLKPYCLANTYKTLLYRTLEGKPERKKGWIAAKFLIQAIITDPSILFKKVIFKALLKLATITILPDKCAHLLLAKIPCLNNTSTLLGYMKTDPFLIKN